MIEYIGINRLKARVTRVRPDDGKSTRLRTRFTLFCMNECNCALGMPLSSVRS